MKGKVWKTVRKQSMISFKELLRGEEPDELGFSGVQRKSI